MPIRSTDFVATGLVKVDPYTLSQTLEGTNGDDTIDGSVGHDTIYGLGGKDTLIGRDGNDRLEGGGGDDRIYADAGNDVASGEDSAAFDAWTDFTGSNANQAWAQGYLYFTAYGDKSTSDWGVSVHIDINGDAPNEGFGIFEAVRLSHVSLDQIGAIGQSFYGFHYNFVV